MPIARRLIVSARLLGHRTLSSSVLSSTATSRMNKYQDLSRDELVARLAALESSHASSSKLPPATEPAAWEKKKTKKRESKSERFDVTKHPCRKIALRFSYDGAPFSGLATQKGGLSSAVQDDSDAVLTVEDVFWKALTTTRLVGEDQSMGDVGWSRCGRTDRGVSAGGQVVALWIRSRRVDQWKERRELAEFVAATKREKVEDGAENKLVHDEEEVVERETGDQESNLFASDASPGNRIEADPNSEEISYVSVLNSVLPPTIRVQAWSPVRPRFSSRFDCRYRHYKYFFNSGCPFVDHTSTKGPVPRLDVSLMQKAAQRFLGEHDFRHFCKVDPSKQIDNYRRRIDGISINQVSDPWPVRGQGQRQSNKTGREVNGVEETEFERMYVMDLRGTAFLYHQVRHMMAVLFLVGARFEKPSIIDELLNVEEGGVALDRLLMRRRGLVLDDDQNSAIKTTLPESTATTMRGNVASDNFESGVDDTPSPLQVDSELSEEERKLKNLFVYHGKPEYKMASDRPLMLWECGFKEEDIQWRSGTYDGPLSTIASDDPITSDVNSCTSLTTALLHSHWSSLAVTTELYKHFLLALPLDISNTQAGYIPASTFFDQSASPTLQKESVKTNGSRPHWQGMSSSYTRQIVPLGDGQFRPVQEYKPLLHTRKQEPPEIKNAKYLHGPGKRRADRKALVDE